MDSGYNYTKTDANVMSNEIHTVFKVWENLELKSENHRFSKFKRSILRFFSAHFSARFFAFFSFLFFCKQRYKIEDHFSEWSEKWNLQAGDRGSVTNFFCRLKWKMKSVCGGEGVRRYNIACTTVQQHNMYKLYNTRVNGTLNILCVHLRRVACARQILYKIKRRGLVKSPCV